MSNRHAIQSHGFAPCLSKAREYSAAAALNDAKYARQWLVYQKESDAALGIP